MRNYDVILYAFVLTVQYAMLGVHCPKLTKYVAISSTLHCMIWVSQQLAENELNRTSILLSNRIQSFSSIVQWIFELSQWWPLPTCFNCFCDVL